MNLRDWLIVVGVVIILGILIDGYRRMRLARKDSLQMSRDMGGDLGDMANSPLDDDFNPELPGGGARVVRAGSDSGASDEAESLAMGISDEQSFDNSDAEPDARHASMIEGADDGMRAARTEPTFTALDEVSADNDGVEPGFSAPLSASKDDRFDNETTLVRAGARVTDTDAVHEAAQAESTTAGTAQSGPQEVLVINVDAKAAPFAGADIKQLLEACGLEHGDMSIFHRHEEDDLLSPIQFSVANAVEPGYFDPANMPGICTPGVSFFMSLPGPKDCMKAFDYMLETAQCFAKNLGGELRDEQRSVMTTQTIEHCRQRIREFERKQLSRSRA